VDKPTNGTSQSVIAAFDAIKQSNSTVTYGEIVGFLNTSFQGEGLELEANPLENFPTSPRAFQSIPDPYVKAFALAVHNIWNLLIRDTNESKVCTSGRCESSLIPLNHTFVVPGGRFREQCEYLPFLFLFSLNRFADYWDSKFILDGLLKSELYSVAKSTLDNFMDEIQQFGFIPNGGRIYYLNRSQPPVFTTVSRIGCFVLVEPVLIRVDDA
jgi:alpha,alpha-trehalase